MNEGDRSNAAAIARQNADEILARRDAARARRANALKTHPDRLDLTVQVATAGGVLAAGSLQTAGFLLALGDSWFDYPLYDVLKLLDDNYGYNVESPAHRGDPVEAMAYQGGQLDKFLRCLDKVLAQGATPKAILVSGGGDDIAGSEFGMLLNNATSGIAGWNPEIVDGLLNQRIRIAYMTMLGSVNHLCQQRLGETIPVFVHGYDYPVPDGRGFLGGWPFPGPWLEPGFREKLFIELPASVTLMHDIIDRFNDTLRELLNDAAFANVHYLDLRGTLSTDLHDDTYQEWWGNELHPTEKGFSAIADKFAAALQNLT